MREQCRGGLLDESSQIKISRKTVANKHIDNYGDVSSTATNPTGNDDDDDNVVLPSSSKYGKKKITNSPVRSLSIVLMNKMHKRCVFNQKC